MLGMTIVGRHSHMGSQALEVCYCLVNAFLDDLQGNFRLISHLRLRLEFMNSFLVHSHMLQRQELHCSQSNSIERSTG